MTKEELIELGIYVPEKVDSSIVVNLLMGNCVLCEYYDPIMHMDVPICLTPCTTKDISPIKYGLKILKNFGDKQITTAQSMFGTIVWIDGIYSNYFLNNAQIKDVLKYF